MSAPPPSNKDHGQVLQYAFDDASGRIRTDAVISPDGHDLEISHLDDSIAIGTATDLFTSTTVGPAIGLDVNIIGGTVQVDTTGLATSANQVIGNTSLASIDSKLTAPLAVTGPVTDTQLRASPVPVSGTITADAGSGNFTVVQSTGSNLHVDIDNFPVSQAVTQSTSPWVVSGSVTANIGTTGGLALDSSLSTIHSDLTTIASEITSSQPRNLQDGTGTPITSTASALDVNIKSSSVTQPISGTVSVSNFPATQAVTQSTSPWVVSGTVTSNIGTTGGLALDSSLSTIATDITTSQPRKLQDGAGNPITSTTSALDVNIKSTGVTQPISGSVSVSNFPATQAVTQNTSPWVVSGSVTANVGTTGGLALDSSLTTIDTDIKASQPRKLQDGAGNAITSQVSGAQRALDVGIDVAGVQVDPRTRTWNLSSGTDSVSAVTNSYTQANVPINNSYASTNVTTSAYVQLVASTSNALNAIEIYDTSGQILYLATGGSGSEVNLMIIPQGGNGLIPVSIPASTRISVKAITATANAGYLSINFWK